MPCLRAARISLCYPVVCIILLYLHVFSCCIIVACMFLWYCRVGVGVSAILWCVRSAPGSCVAVNVCVLANIPYCICLRCAERGGVGDIYVHIHII